MKDLHEGILLEFAAGQAIASDRAKYVGDVTIRRPKPTARTKGKCGRCGEHSPRSYYCPVCVIIRNAMRGSGTARRLVANKRRSEMRPSRSRIKLAA